jgi:Rhodopirellula transposase DDE domain
MDYSLRVNRKAIATDSSPDRDQQFRYISSLRTRFERQGLPIISVDTKKRELVGNFKNNGVKWDRTPVRVNDHDFRSDAIGVAIPYGIYDLLANRGSVFVGVSHDTAAFAAHSIAGWWKRDGANRYYRGRQLLILADTGGSNSCRTGAWKTELQTQLCNSFGLTVTVAHYPTGASNGIPSSTDSSPKSPKTGPPSLLIATPKSSTSSAIPAPEPGSQSRPTSTEGSTQPAPHPIQSTSDAFASNDIRPCPPGTIRLLQCESIVASALSVR